MTFEFDRYINGQLMAEGVTIERQGNLPDAMREAARIASRGPNGEVPVLVLRAEALSRTGAVKVKALEWEERKTRLGTVWWSAPNPLGGLSIEAASENDKIAAQADYERRVLSALEPAAPEGSQTCATEGCDNPATNEFIRGDVGSFYCGDCFGKVIEVCEARRSPEGQQPAVSGVRNRELKETI